GIATIASSYQNGGQLVIHSDGTYTYTPPSSVQNPHADPNNPTVATPVTDTYTYTVTDADGSRSTATLTFQITDTGVTAVNDTGGSVVEGSGAINSVTGVLANDTLCQDAASVSQTTPFPYATHFRSGIATIASSYQNGGQLVIHSDGTYTYT